MAKAKGQVAVNRHISVVIMLTLTEKKYKYTSFKHVFKIPKQINYQT